MRQVNQLDVKTKAIDSSRFDQGPADAHAKSFESALRVPKRQARRQTNDQVEYAAALFTAPGLMHSDQAPIERARSEGEIAFTVKNRIDQFGCFVNWSRQIRIRKQHDIRARFPESQTYRIHF